MNKIININNLSYSISKDKPILNGINIIAEPQDFIILLGGNGSGKSTLLKLLNKTYCNYSGSISINGRGGQRISRSEYAGLVTTITQNTEASLFPELSVFENYILYRRKRDHKCLLSLVNPKDKKQLAENLKDYNLKLPSHLDTQVSKLSGGEKQALSLYLCLNCDSEILLLDEHTSALDPLSARALMKLTADKVASSNLTCIMATHSLEDAMMYGNKLIALKDGEIIFAACPEEKKKLTPQDLRDYCY